MRRTAASWLVQDGVPLYDVQALLGHEDYGTTQRYAHLAPGLAEQRLGCLVVQRPFVKATGGVAEAHAAQRNAHDKVRESWARRSDASVTHDAKEARRS
jgi:hypothetical protein